MKKCVSTWHFKVSKTINLPWTFSTAFETVKSVIDFCPFGLIFVLVPGFGVFAVLGVRGIFKIFVTDFFRISSKIQKVYDLVAFVRESSDNLRSKIRHKEIQSGYSGPFRYKRAPVQSAGLLSSRPYAPKIVCYWKFEEFWNFFNNWFFLLIKMSHLKIDS